MNTFTTTSNQARPVARLRLIAIAVGICALAIPTAASANLGFAPEQGAAKDGVPSNAGFITPDHTALHESLAPSGGSSTSGTPSLAPVTETASPSTGDGFDWADAALGAGVALAIAALGGIALITVRRRTAVSASASAG